MHHHSFGPDRHRAHLVTQSMPLAQILNIARNGAQIVSGQSGEQVVLQLVVETSGEPIGDDRRGDVAGGGCLGRDKVLGLRVNL